MPRTEKRVYVLLLSVCACPNCLSAAVFSREIKWNMYVSASKDRISSCTLQRSILLASHTLLFASTVNKHKPWIETSYHGVITENTDVVLLDPPLVALDKDAPIPYAGTIHCSLMSVDWWKIIATGVMRGSFRLNGSSAR